MHQAPCLWYKRLQCVHEDTIVFRNAKKACEHTLGAVIRLSPSSMIQRSETELA